MKLPIHSCCYGNPGAGAWLSWLTLFTLCTATDVGDNYIITCHPGVDANKIALGETTWSNSDGLIIPSRLTGSAPITMGPDRQRFYRLIQQPAN
jgi:hypothetical protein